jgi:hypothetical protein
VVEREQDVINRRAVSHDDNLALTGNWAAVFPRNRGCLNSPMGGIGPRQGRETGRGLSRKRP